jgi:hypothetical protein
MLAYDATDAIKWRRPDVIDSKAETQSHATPFASVNRTLEFTGLLQASRVRRRMRSIPSRDLKKENDPDRDMVVAFHNLYRRIAFRVPLEHVGESQLRHAFDSMFYRLLIHARSAQLAEHCQLVLSQLPKATCDEVVFVTDARRTDSKSRSQEIEDIELQLELLSNAFSRILTLVADQGETVERIDSHIGSAEDNTKQTRRSVSRVNTSMGSLCRVRRSTMIQLLVMMVIFVCATIILSF